VDSRKIVEIQSKYDVKGVTPLGDDINLITYQKRNDEDKSYKPNVSIAISAMITANSRLWMYQFKNENVLYTDTDSIDTTEITKT